MCKSEGWTDGTYSQSLLLGVTSANRPTAFPCGDGFKNRCGCSNGGSAPIPSSSSRCENPKLWLRWSWPSLNRHSSPLLCLPDMTPGRHFDALCCLRLCAFIAFPLCCCNTLVLFVFISITAQCNTLESLSECSFFFPKSPKATFRPFWISICR